jgi:hypothetical protein
MNKANIGSMASAQQKSRELYQRRAQVQQRHQQGSREDCLLKYIYHRFTMTALERKLGSLSQGPTFEAMVAEEIVWS